MAYNETQANIECYMWNVATGSVCALSDGLEHVLTRIKLYGTEFVCVDSSRHACGQIVLFHDCDYLPQYPECFYKIKVFDSFGSLRECIDSIDEKFALAANLRFRRTSHEVQGEKVYLEIDTGRYWYLDNLHRNHYEVFDSNGNHIGESDMDGIVNSSRRDKKKKLNF